LSTTTVVVHNGKTALIDLADSMFKEAINPRHIRKVVNVAAR